MRFFFFFVTKGSNFCDWLHCISWMHEPVDNLHKEIGNIDISSCEDANRNSKLREREQRISRQLESSSIVMFFV